MPTESYERGLDGKKPGVLDTLLQSEQGLKDMERGYKDYLGNQAIAEAVADEIASRAAAAKSSSNYGSDSSSSSSSAPDGLVDMILGLIGLLVLGIPVAAIAAIVPAFVIGLVFGVPSSTRVNNELAYYIWRASAVVIYFFIIIYGFSATGKSRKNHG